MNKICSQLLLSVTVLASTCHAQGKTTLVKEQKGPGMASYLILIPATEFSDKNLIRLANRYSSESLDVKLLQLGLYTDEETAYDSRGKSVDHISFDRWKKEFETRTKRKVTCAALFLKYGNSAALKILHADGGISEIKIVGDNVFRPVLGDLPLNLLHVSFVEQGLGDARKLVPHFYFTVPRKISLKEAEALTREFSNLLGLSNFTLRLREDQWFIFDSFYPWTNPFEGSDAPPTLKESAKSVEFICQPTLDSPCFQTAVGAN